MEAVEAAVSLPFLRRHRRALVLAAAVLIAAAAAALGVALGRGPSSAQAPVAVRPNSVTAIDPKTNRVVADVRVGDMPTTLAYGVDGVWVANNDSGTISRIDPRTLVARTVGVPGRPADTAAAEGQVFVAELFGERLIVLGPEGDVQDTITIGGGGVRRDSGLGGIVVGSGKLWLFESRRGVVVRIDPSTGRVLATVPLANALNGIAATGDGVWIAAGRQAVEIDAATDVVKNIVTIGRQDPEAKRSGKASRGSSSPGTMFG